MPPKPPRKTTNPEQPAVSPSMQPSYTDLDDDIEDVRAPRNVSISPTRGSCDPSLLRRTSVIAAGGTIAAPIASQERARGLSARQPSADLSIMTDPRANSTAGSNTPRATKDFNLKQNLDSASPASARRGSYASKQLPPVPALPAQRDVRQMQQAAVSASRRSTEQNMPLDSNETMLWTACKKDNVDDFISALSAGLSVNQYDSKGRTPFLMAARYGAVQLIQYLLSIQEVDIHAQDKDGQNALHHVCTGERQVHAQALQVLVSDERGLALVHQQNFYGWTPLMVAAYSGNLEFCKILVDCHASLDERNRDGASALDLARARGFHEVTQYLEHVQLVMEQEKPMPVPQYLSTSKLIHADSHEPLLPSPSHIEQQAYRDPPEPTRTPENYGANAAYNQQASSSTYNTADPYQVQPRMQTGLVRKTSLSRFQNQTPPMTNLPRSQSLRQRQRDSMKQENAPAPAEEITSSRDGVTCWVLFSWIVTFWMPPYLLSALGLKTPDMRQAWREKFALCFIIFLISAFLAFLSFGFQKLCVKPQVMLVQDFKTATAGNTPSQNLVVVRGNIYSIPAHPVRVPNATLAKFVGSDANDLFPLRPEPCSVPLPASAGCASPLYCHPDVDTANLVNTFQSTLAFTWHDILGNTDVFTYGGKVYSAANYIDRDNGFLGDPINTIISNGRGRDLSRSLSQTPEFLAAKSCFDAHYWIGQVDSTSPQCFLNNIIVITAFVILTTIIALKFIAAVSFSWLLSWRLGKLSKSRHPVSNIIMLVTCYSEGEDSIRTTLDSLAMTDYNDHQKILLVICDGLITGSGNRKSTPDLVLEMLDLDEASQQLSEPCSYFAIGDGAKQHNMGRVYTGHYKHAQHRRVPMLVIVKCGTPAEQNAPKAGNRGKRDSQLVLMHFLSRVTFNERMTPLDYEIFWKMHQLTDIAPDRYDIVIMVDADTQVKSDSLARMVSAMERDPSVMGLCGETKIANKSTSFTTRIQVFEYAISHHLGKSFESVFGGVTCLPGCFCMYRIRVRNDDGTIVPILANPDIVESYSDNMVDTLHKKNLLLLGEDRYLTTLMLRAFPKRNLIFVPKAVCRTQVPDEFKVLLSQRRRWINSTVHNLLELVLVPQLCGTFCCSMQFIIFLELIGTAVLPASVGFLIYLIVDTIVRQTTDNAIPLAFFVLILFLQAFLVLFAMRKAVYLYWMLWYVLAIPIWNFVLPLYAFWHFDDFSWGATRQITGTDTGHGGGGGAVKFDRRSIPLKRWNEYEKIRLMQQAPAAASSSYQSPPQQGPPPQTQPPLHQRHPSKGNSNQNNQYDIASYYEEEPFQQPVRNTSGSYQSPGTFQSTGPYQSPGQYQSPQMYQNNNAYQGNYPADSYGQPQPPVPTQPYGGGRRTPGGSVYSSPGINTSRSQLQPSYQQQQPPPPQNFPPQFSQQRRF